MPDVLVEIGCEELPASACREAITQVPGLVADALAAQRLPDVPVEVMVGPRRIAMLIPGLPAERAGRTREVRGPAEQAAYGPEGTPTAAATGFARAQGIAADALVLREDGGRRFVFAEIAEPAVATAELVPELARAVVNGIRFSKNMRWGAGTGLRFSRPVRWIVAKFGPETVRFDVHGLTAGDVSRGHRFLGGPTEIASPEAYRAALRAVGVIADHRERRKEIVAQLNAAAAAIGCSWRDPGGKLEEVLFLVEHPSAIVGDIRPEHLRLPERVLVTAMQSHQRYFPLTRADGSLEPRFLAISNGDPAHAETITRGNSDVLDARLQDAAFSFDRDREAGLAALDARLDTIVFHKRLGSMADKRDRLAAGAGDLARAVGLGADAVAAAERAGRLAKVDQGAVLVAEFSDLQGYVGAEYAALEGEDDAVVVAVREHYLPEGPESPLPSTSVAACVALADKIDNLVGAFLVGETPTGSKDPYGLRRAAAGLVRVVSDRGWDFDLAPVLAGAAARLVADGTDMPAELGAPLAELDEFIGDRIAFQLSEAGVSAECAAAAQGAHLGSIVATIAWARALDAACAEAAFWEVWTASTRLVRIAARGDHAGSSFVSVGDPGEDALADACQRAAAGIGEARTRRDLPAAIAAARPLAAAVDRFFTDVLVNAEDAAVRARRYGLVRQTAEVLGGIADFTRVTDQGGQR
jgi:glycyl-tRNA synthetase beta chain